MPRHTEGPSIVHNSIHYTEVPIGWKISICNCPGVTIGLGVPIGPGVPIGAGVG